jgi:hypothetical protein
MTTRPSEKLETENVNNATVAHFQFLASLLTMRTAASHHGCNRRVSWPSSLSLGLGGLARRS